jgi:hypothetical protein
MWRRAARSCRVTVVIPTPAGAQTFDAPGAKRRFPTRSPLKKHDFIIIEARPGHSNCVTVLEKTCTGTPTPYCGDIDLYVS